MLNYKTKEKYTPFNAHLASSCIDTDKKKKQTKKNINKTKWHSINFIVSFFVQRTTEKQKKSKNYAIRQLMGKMPTVSIDYYENPTTNGCYDVVLKYAELIEWWL